MSCWPGRGPRRSVPSSLNWPAIRRLPGSGCVAAWLVPAVRLPAEVARDTVIVFAALWRRLARGEEPASGFRELPARYGGDSAAAVTRRALLVGGRSLAPNSFVVGIDPGRDVMLIHQLVVNQGEAAE